jgi:PAS domain-containing protein
MERAKVLLWILLVILFLVQPALFTYFLLYGRPLSFLQSIIMIILLSSALVCLKKRHPHAASRIMILSHMAIIWYASFSMIFSGMPLIKKLGLPMGLLGILTIIPLVARKTRFYGNPLLRGNILLLVLFSFILIRFHPSEIASIRHHSLILTIAFFVTSATTYLIFMSHTRIIKKLLKAQAEIAVKNEELAASNEEFETMNNELVRSHEEIKISEIRYRELYDNALIGMMTVRNPEGDIIKINQSCGLMRGYNDKSEIENRLNIRDLMASA